jgi:drug/metabolite transporter (DMT)-like permease
LISILFGLTSAITWGVGDYAGGIASRRTNAYRATWYGEAFGLVMLLVTAAVYREQPLPWQDWAWCVLAGALGATGLLILYRSLAAGQMSTAAPVSGLMAAALPVVVGLLLQGLPRPASYLGFALALLAVWLISQGTGASPKALARLTELRLPLISGICFGMYFILIHQGSQHALLWPMIAARCSGTICLTIFAAVKREVRLPGVTLLPWILLNAVGDIGGNTFYVLAGQAGRLDVAAVLSSLYPGTTVILAWLLLREKITRFQLAGILAALAAIAMLTI